MRNGILTFFGGLVLSALMSFTAAAQQVEIEETITRQFDAFRADDFDSALEFATPRLQQFFQTPENFRRMVTTGYPMVQNPAEVRFLDRRGEGADIWQVVQITDGRGFTHLLAYLMQQTEDGWRIGAVQILDAPGANV
jgi:ketosteroid isomerase-like protein